MKKIDEALRPRSTLELKTKFHGYSRKKEHSDLNAMDHASRSLEAISYEKPNVARTELAKAEIYNNMSKRYKKAVDIINKELSTRKEEKEPKSMKTLEEVLLGGYAPKSPDEKRFAAKHKVQKHEDPAGNDDKLFKASNIKAVNRETPENHGYNPGSDEKVYEETEIEESNDNLRQRREKGREIRKEISGERGVRRYKKWRKSNFNDLETTRKIIDRKRAFKEETTVDEAVRKISSTKVTPVNTNRNEANFGDFKMFTGTGTAPDPNFYHIVSAHPTMHLGRNIGRQIWSSVNLPDHAEKDYDKLSKAGNNLILVRPKSKG